MRKPIPPQATEPHEILPGILSNSAIAATFDLENRLNPPRRGFFSSLLLRKHKSAPEIYPGLLPLPATAPDHPSSASTPERRRSRNKNGLMIRFPNPLTGLLSRDQTPIESPTTAVPTGGLGGVDMPGAFEMSAQRTPVYEVEPALPPGRRDVRTPEDEKLVRMPSLSREMEEVKGRGRARANTLGALDGLRADLRGREVDRDELWLSADAFDEVHARAREREDVRRHSSAIPVPNRESPQSLKVAGGRPNGGSSNSAGIRITTPRRSSTQYIPYRPPPQHPAERERRESPPYPIPPRTHLQPPQSYRPATTAYPSPPTTPGSRSDSKHQLHTPTASTSSTSSSLRSRASAGSTSKETTITAPEVVGGNPYLSEKDVHNFHYFLEAKKGSHEFMLPVIPAGLKKDVAIRVILHVE